MTYERLPSGSWRVSVMVNRRTYRRTVPANTPKRELRRIESELRMEADTIAASAGSELTVAELCHVWINAGEQRRAAVTTYGYRRITDNHIAPADIGSMPVSHVRTAHVQRFQDAIVQTMSPSRVRHTRAVMSGAFKWAVASGFIAQNPTASTLPLPTARSNVKATDPDDWNAAVERGDQVHDGLSSLIRFIGVTGCRLGEALALTWTDIAGSTVHITEAISAVPGSGVHVKDTKTHRNRHVPISQAMRDVLEQRRRMQQTLCAEHGLDFDEHGYVWSTDGTGAEPWRPDTAGKWIRKAGVLALEMRHMTATRMLAGGTPVHTVAAILGHASTKMTQDVYGEAIPNNHAAAAEVMEALAD